jgi:hypothetical protein
MLLLLLLHLQVADFLAELLRLFATLTVSPPLTLQYSLIILGLDCCSHIEPAIHPSRP